MYEIVAGVDESVASERSLDRALWEAQSSGQLVRVVHAWTEPVWTGGLPGSGYLPPNLAADAEEHARERVDTLLAKGLGRRTGDTPLAASTQTLRGEPGRVLAEASRDAALLVVGGRGHGYLSSALLGSATAFVLHHASCPVMVVPEAGGPAGQFRRVVVGVDGSPSSRTALQWGLDAARRHHCALVAVHSWLLTTLPGRSAIHFSRAEDEARTWLAHEVERAFSGSRDVDVFPELAGGEAARSLMETAGADDLLVLGSRGRGGFSSLLLGSVATQCAQHARGVVAVVHARRGRLDP